jgi:hypothetical protein
MQSLVNNGNCEKYKLSQALVGQNASMDFNPSIMQIGFLKDYDTIRLLPLVHRNTATFFGMDNKDNYLIWRHEEGTFTALSKEGMLSMWSAVTGQVL